MKNTKKKSFFTTIAVATIATIATSGIAYAANIDAKSQLGGGSGDSFSFQDATIEVGSIKVGKQGSGGVTFFNGTIINNTTTNGVDNPVTISDNLRVDGGIQRGHNLPSDGWGLKFLDSARVYGSLDVDDNLLVSDNATIGKNTAIGGQLGVGGELIAQSQFTANSNADISGNLTVGGNHTVTGNVQADSFSTSGDIIFSGDRYIMLGGENAQPLSSEADIYELSPSGALQIIATNTSSEDFIIPIRVPDGAGLQSATMYTVDADGAGSDQGVSVEIFYGDITGLFYVENTLGTMSSPIIQSANLGTHIVDNSVNHYYARVNIANNGGSNSDASLIGLRINYTAIKPS